MILLNFSHPLTPQHLARIAELTGEVPKLIEAPTQFDHEHSFADQVRELVDSIGLSPAEWQTTSLLVNPQAVRVAGRGLRQ